LVTGDDARGLPAGCRLCVLALWLVGEEERAGEQVKERRSIVTKAMLNYNSVPYGSDGVKLFTHGEKKVGQV